MTEKVTPVQTPYFSDKLSPQDQLALSTGDELIGHLVLHRDFSLAKAASLATYLVPGYIKAENRLMRSSSENVDA